MSRSVSRILFLCSDLSMRPTRTVGGPRHPVPIWPCFQRGLHALAVTSKSRELLPHDFNLTRGSCCQHPKAVCFCCTFRRVAPPLVAQGAVPYEVRTFPFGFPKPLPDRLGTIMTNRRRAEAISPSWFTKDGAKGWSPKIYSRLFAC